MKPKPVYAWAVLTEDGKFIRAAKRKIDLYAIFIWTPDCIFQKVKIVRIK